MVQSKIATAFVELRASEAALFRDVKSVLGEKLAKKIDSMKSKFRIPITVNASHLKKSLSTAVNDMKSSASMTRGIKLPLRIDAKLFRQDLRDIVAKFKSGTTSIKIPLRVDSKLLRKDIRDVVARFKSVTTSIKIPLRVNANLIRRDIRNVITDLKGTSLAAKIPLRADPRSLTKSVNEAIAQVNAGGKIKPIRVPMSVFGVDRTKLANSINSIVRRDVPRSIRSNSPAIQSAWKRAFAVSLPNPFSAAGRAASAGIGGLGAGLGVGMGVGGLGVAGAGFAAGAGLAGATMVAANFEQALQDAFAIMKTTTEQEKLMSDEARKLAIEWGKSATDVANGYQALASANMNAEQAIAALPAVTKFAVASNMELADSTVLLMETMGAFKLASKDPQQNLKNLTYLSDRLAKANDIGQGSVEDFAMAMATKSAGEFASTGKSVEELLAVLAAMANQGIKSRRAGEEVTIMMLGLKQAAIANHKAFRKLGISVFDPMTGQLRHTADIIGDFETKLGGASVAQKTFALEALGLENASAKVMAQMIGSSKTIRDFHKDLMKADGQIDQLANKRMDTFIGSVKRLWSAIKDIGLTVGTPFIDWLRDIADNMKNSTNEVGDFIKSLDLTKEAIQGLVPVTKDTFKAMFEHMKLFTAHFDAMNELAVLNTEQMLAEGFVVPGLREMVVGDIERKRKQIMQKISDDEQKIIDKAEADRIHKRQQANKKAFEDAQKAFLEKEGKKDGSSVRMPPKFHADEARAPTFVGIEEMSKRIQGSLTNRDKNLEQLKILAQIAEESKKNLDIIAKDVPKKKVIVPVFAPDN